VSTEPEGDGAAAPGPAGGDLDRDPRRWGMLALLSLSLLFGMSAWFAASAVAPELQARWGLTPSGAGWLTTIVQVGFVVGTAFAAVLNLADVVPSRLYFGVSALLAAAANLALLVVPGFAVALALRFLTGFFLAGVYPPGSGRRGGSRSGPWWAR